MFLLINFHFKKWKNMSFYEYEEFIIIIINIILSKRYHYIYNIYNKINID